MVLSNNDVFYEFQEIAAAHNYHVSGDFGASDVPLEAVVTNKDRFVFTLSKYERVTGAVTSATIQQYFVVPFDCEVVKARITCPVVSGTPTIVLYRESPRSSKTVFGGTVYFDTATDVSVFSNFSDYTTGWANDTSPVFYPLVSKLFAGDILSMRYTVAGGAYIEALTYAIEAKAFHSTQ